MAGASVVQSGNYELEIDTGFYKMRSHLIQPQWEF